MAILCLYSNFHRLEVCGGCLFWNSPCFLDLNMVFPGADAVFAFGALTTLTGAAVGEAETAFTEPAIFAFG